jgi:DNA-binding NarL/FixJ family response regulator
MRQIVHSGISSVTIVQERWEGEALEWLEMAHPQKRAETVLISSNPCPEYALDLLEYDPGGLIICAQTKVEAALERAISRLTQGERVFDHPSMPSYLLPSERAILRFLPHGMNSREVAACLDISHKTVRNRITIVGQKLGLENRLQIVMYYTGQWQWLESYREAFVMFCGPPYLPSLPYPPEREV